MEIQKPDPNPFPPIKPIQPMEGIRSAIDRVRSLGRVTELCLSEHIRQEDVPQ